ncbi:MAG: hypothetical protein KF805_12550 [Phycisphaeraceae bacterium]|nr:hypothetical protein [Phycisphaeraceae bacterium]
MLFDLCGCSLFEHLQASVFDPERLRVKRFGLNKAASCAAKRSALFDDNADDSGNAVLCAIAKISFHTTSAQSARNQVGRHMFPCGCFSFIAFIHSLA